MSYAEGIARSVKRYQPDDKPALREFQRQFFGENARQHSESWHEWLFEKNPNRQSEGASLWICVRDGAVVGQQGSIPVVLKVGESERNAAWLIDWMIHPAWRLKGVAPALLSINAQHNELMLGLSLEDLAYRTVHRSGWEDIGRLSLFARPLDPAASLRALNLPGALAVFTPRALVGGTASAAARLSGVVSGLSMEGLDDFDERVDGIWAAAKDEWPIVVKRNFRYLRWRFDLIPERAVYSRYYFKRRGEVVGYAVVRLAAWRGKTIGRVIDYFAQRRYIAPMLAMMIDALNTPQVMAVFIEHHVQGTELTLRSLGCFNVRPEHRQRFMYHVRDKTSPLAGQLAKHESWFLVPADADFDYNLLGQERAALSS